VHHPPESPPCQNKNSATSSALDPTTSTREYPPTRNQSKITRRMLISSLNGRDWADSTYHDLQDPPQPTSRSQRMYQSISSAIGMPSMMTSNSQGSPFQSQSTHLPCILNLKCHFVYKSPQSSKYLILTP
jgi:hypothetical protein